LLPESLALVNTVLLVSSKSRIEARLENIVKVIVKVIRKGIYYNGIRVGSNGKKRGETFPAPMQRLKCL
jgi:hypothetical protein